ncbi:hypothetical protein B0H19DRAFT_1267733 [Mycena capillaripes]|nr:hypothetical protein B0H19DRAFT_1267733 [Mycena capillaripes]
MLSGPPLTKIVGIDYTDLLRYINTTLTPQSLTAIIQKEEDHGVILSFLSRSACVLTHLSLNIMAQDSVLLQILTVTPALLILELAFTSCNHVESSRDIVPRLHTLRCTLQTKRAISDTFLAVLYKQPTLAVAELTCAHAKPLSAQALEGFERLAAQGMRIRLKGRGCSWPGDALNDVEGGYNVFDPEKPLPQVFYSF